MLASMQPRRYIGMIISAMLIIALLVIFTDPWSTLRSDDNRVKLRDASEVDRISLSDQFDSTLLIRQENRWMLFGQEPVNPVAVENLLFAAQRLQINSILSEDAGWTGQPVRKIRFFHGEKPLLEYGFLSHGDQFMVRPTGSDRTYFVSISGYTGLNLANLFSTSPNHYREHNLIDLLPSEISLIEIELASGKAFRFTQDPNGEITCFPANSETVFPPGSLDELSIRLLFSYFTSIRYEKQAGIPASQLLDAGGSADMIARLHIESQRGDKHTLNIFPLPQEQGEEAHMFKALVTYNNDPEALVVNYIYLDVLMRDLSHYFASEE